MTLTITVNAVNAVTLRNAVSLSTVHTVHTVHTISSVHNVHRERGRRSGSAEEAAKASRKDRPGNVSGVLSRERCPTTNPEVVPLSHKRAASQGVSLLRLCQNAQVLCLHEDTIFQCPIMLVMGESVTQNPNENEAQVGKGFSEPRPACAIRLSALPPTPRDRPLSPPSRRTA
jgi:hypothetical protein